MASKGPLDLVDSALAFVREAGFSFAFRAWIAGVPLALTALVLYEIDGIEGVGGLREVGALAMLLAWWWRVHGLATLAGEGVRAMDETSDAPTAAPSWLGSLRSATLFGLGAMPWALFFVLIGLAGPMWVVVCLPLLALRGAMAPSWLAVTGSSDRRGFGTVRAAIRDTGFRRASSALAELVVLMATVAIAINAMVLASLGLSLAKSVLGLDIAFASAFVSPSNTFFLALVAAFACVFVEPLRAALSAVQYDEARSRLEGRDVERLVARAIRGSATLALAFAVLGVHGSVRADDKPPFDLAPETSDIPAEVAPQVAVAEPAPEAALVVLAPEDEAILTRARTILAQPEYEQDPAAGSNSLASWIDKLWRAFLEWMRQKDEATGSNIERVDLDLSIPPWVYFAIVGVIAFVIGALVMFRRKKTVRRTDEETFAGQELDLSVRPEKRLDDASALAARGEFRGALRSLYVATLVALGRRGLLRLDPHRTNHEYLDALRGAPERTEFAQFTRQFDLHWYGEVPATRDDYDTCRALAERICAPRAEVRS